MCVRREYKKTKQNAHENKKKKCNPPLYIGHKSQQSTQAADTRKKKKEE